MSQNRPHIFSGGEFSSRRVPVEVGDKRLFKIGREAPRSSSFFLPPNNQKVSTRSWIILEEVVAHKLLQSLLFLFLRLRSAVWSDHCRRLQGMVSILFLAIVASLAVNPWAPAS